MDHRRRWCGISLVFLSLSACQTIGGQPRYPFYTPAQIDTLAMAFDQKTIHDCFEKPDAAARTACRDEIVNDQLEVIDFAYRTFTREISQTSGTVDITGDILAAALSGASTVATATRAKTILSGIATVVTGGKTSIDRNLFLQQAAHVLIGRMDALRDKARVPIRAGQTQTDDDYPLWQALRDINTYLEAGSFGAAITDIERNTANVKEDAQQAAQSVVTEPFGADANTKILRKFWMPDGHKINPDNQAKLQVEMKKTGVPDGLSMALFLNAAKYAGARATAVKDLNLTN
jgi:hypothetical protein